MIDNHVAHKSIMSFFFSWSARVSFRVITNSGITVACCFVLVNMSVSGQEPGFWTFTFSWVSLTHWGWVTHIYICNLTILVSDNDLSPSQCQAIIWVNAGILLIGPLGTNFSGILIVIHTFSFKKMHWKMSSGKWRPCCLGLCMLRIMVQSYGVAIEWCISGTIAGTGKIMVFCWGSKLQISYYQFGLPWVNFLGKTGHKSLSWMFPP